MPCERFRDALTAAAAGESVTQALAAHLAECSACESELAALRRLVAAADDELSALATAEPSPALRARIREAVAKAGPAPAWRGSFAWALAAATVVAVAAFLVWRTAAGRLPAGSPVAQATRPPAPGSAPGSGVPAASPKASTSVASTGPGRSAPAAPSAPVLRPSSARPVPVRATRRAEPEILVPPGEQEALLRFAAHLQRRTISPASFLVADLSSPLPEAKALEIQPLSPVPLDPTEESGTD